jgi:hypothetical protein
MPQSESPVIPNSSTEAAARGWLKKDPLTLVGATLGVLVLQGTSRRVGKACSSSLRGVSAEGGASVGNGLASVGKGGRNGAVALGLCLVLSALVQALFCL